MNTDDKVMMPMPIQMDVLVQWLIHFHNSYPWVGILFFLMAVDISAGFFAACVTKTLSSSTSQVGMSKKALMILMVGTGAIMQPYAQGLALSQMIATIYIITELISITENVSRAGIPMPKVVTDLLQKLRGEKATMAEQDKAATVINITRASNVNMPSVGESTTTTTTQTGTGESTITKSVRSTTPGPTVPNDGSIH